MTDSNRSFMGALIIFLKGLFMGSADIVPGVSGGTIALITGIYERLVLAIRSIDPWVVPLFLRGLIRRESMEEARTQLGRMDLRFLLVLVMGVGAAFLLLANLMSALLDDYTGPTYGFFFGLILASAFFVYYLHREAFRPLDAVPLVAGILSGLAIVGLSTVNADHSLPIIFLAGTVTLCAMILPGISGAFILLILGQYEYMLGIMRDLTHLDLSGIWVALTYIVGGIVGLLLFSRVLSFLLRRYHGATLMFVVGLMVGALRDPIERVGEAAADPLAVVASALVGVLLVTLISYFGYLRPNSAGSDR
ncbi:MAG: DUF368 domain-containing protein [Methanomassiliicoccales archaeon]